MLFCEKFGLAAWERESVRTPPEGQRCSFGRQPSRGPRRMREAVGETVALATPAPCLSRKGQTLCHYAGADRDARATEATSASYPLRPMGHSEYNGTASPATLNRPTRHGDTRRVRAPGPCGIMGLWRAAYTLPQLLRKATSVDSSVLQPCVALIDAIGLGACTAMSASCQSTNRAMTDSVG